MMYYFAEAISLSERSSASAGLYLVAFFGVILLITTLIFAAFYVRYKVTPAYPSSLIRMHVIAFIAAIASLFVVSIFGSSTSQFSVVGILLALPILGGVFAAGFSALLVIFEPFIKSQGAGYEAGQEMPGRGSKRFWLFVLLLALLVIPLDAFVNWASRYKQSGNSDAIFWYMGGAALFVLYVWALIVMTRPKKQ